MMNKNEEGSLNQIPATSKDIRKEMLESIRKIYPALFSEGNVLNTKELQALVDEYSKPEVERYAFPWAGKTASKRFAFTPSKARLVPDKERSVDFDTTQNLIIEGENLEVLKLLQSSYYKKVKMIYIDPPYNTGHDFVYPDDYSESKQAYWEKGGVMQEGVRIDTNSESSGRYHSNWLSMMQSRLLLARNLLRDDGVIFVSIDDNEVHNLRKLMDEIFGEENFVATLVWTKKEKASGVPPKNMILPNFEYILVYSRMEGLTFKGQTRSMKSYKQNEEGRFWRYMPIQATGEQKNTFDIVNPATGKKYFGNWAFSEEKIRLLVQTGQLHFPENDNGKPTRIVFADEMQNATAPIFADIGMFDSETSTKEFIRLFSGKIFDFPKPVELIRFLLNQATEHDDLILDFFSGSGTTGHAVMNLNSEDGGNRKFILVQLPEATNEKSEAFKAGYKTISQITIERVKRAGAKIKTEKPEVDTGFKVLRLAKSLFPQNMFEVDSEMSEEEKINAWEAYLEQSKQGHLFEFTPDELLFEIVLKDGFDLNFKATPMKEFTKNMVLNVSDGEKSALVCLDGSLQDDTMKTLEQFKDRRFICLERAVDSTRKWGLKRLFGENLWVA